jgi:hypothetical protein
MTGNFNQRFETEVSTKFIPHLLTQEQEESHLSAVSDLPEYAETEENFLNDITRDETSVCYDPETKQ